VWNVVFPLAGELCRPGLGRASLLILAMVIAAGLVEASDDRPEAAGRSIEAGAILKHIQTLASDEFEGRAPASLGEDKTVDYLVGHMKAIGLAPGNPDGTYVQNVPLVGFRSRTKGEIVAGSTRIPLEGPDDWTAVSRHQVPKVEVADSPLIFVGYGVVAPEYDWDDYKGVDVRGKTLVMLVNDPPAADPADPSALDAKVFRGRAMTYYGRWTYKYEIAEEKGATAVLLVHETGPAGYPYEVVVGSWGRENFDIPADDKNAGRAAIEAWIPLDKAKSLLSACGQDFEALKARAATRDFQPVPLDARLSATAENELRSVESRNVIGRLEGTDPALREQTIVYTAHWDHLGRDPALAGDSIYNGAADNASGVAMMLEIARAFTRVEPGPKRSILFLAVTAEEKGLLGAKYYASHPLYPLETTLANINTDVINLWGRTRDITSVGLGQSTLDELLERAARGQGRSIGPDAEPEKGLYFRSDHFEFARAGVPALNAKGGIDYLGRPPGYGQAKRDAYTRDDYHKPSDEVKPDWDLSGAVEDARLLLEVGLAVADGPVWPEWREGSEFRARRQAMLESRKAP
jgi:Zn-dependent M28 family amino/carboxypeptidase